MNNGEIKIPQQLRCGIFVVVGWDGRQSGPPQGRVPAFSLCGPRTAISPLVEMVLPAEDQAVRRLGLPSPSLSPIRDPLFAISE